MPTAQLIIDEVRRIIHDEVVTFRWTDAELIDYINAGTRQTVVLLPSANSVETIESTVSSRVSRQALPAGGIKFLKVSRNYADDGTTPQGVVRYVEKDALDTYDPDWEYVTTKADGANFFEHFCHDSREPTIFYLYPPPVADAKQVAVVYSATPTAITVVGDASPLGDEYTNGIVQYVIFRALTKESRDTLPGAFRQELWQNYLVALGLKRQAEEQVSPENVRPPEGD
jgi:hypothetical protein